MDKARPSLAEGMSAHDLSEFYWMKTELQEFCRSLGLPTSGGKIELIERIKLFLESGRTGVASSRAKSRPTVRSHHQHPLSMDTQIGDDFRCTREIRDFFETHVDKSFHFSVKLQAFIKSNPKLTFRQIADEWVSLKTLKKAGERGAIGPQFEYNQFTRDFFDDPENKGKTRGDCIAAWKLARTGRGDRKYKKKAKKSF